MATTKHTPAPWHISGSQVNVADKDGMILAHCGNALIKNSMGGKTPRNEDEVKANARLIAAAPELLEASEKLIESLNQYSFFAEGYGNGSASISEVNYANTEMEQAQINLFEIIKKAK